MTDDFQERLEQKKQQLEAQQEKQQEAQNLSQDRQQVAGRQYNSSFFESVADSDLDSQQIPHIEDEHPATFSSAHITGQRRKSFEARQDLLNRAKAEQFVVERSPGAILKQYPGMHAVMRSEEISVQNPPTSGPVAEAADEVPSELDAAERRAHRTALREVATTQQSLAVGGSGLRQFTTATSETHTVQHDSDDGLLGRAMGVFNR
jgi:DNA-binding transcriptional regulator GbsR (MarR family)